MWEFIAGALTIFGGLVAFQQIVKPYFGTAKLELRFDREVKDQDRWLGVFFRNPPITNRFLSWLRVDRESVKSLTVQMSVAEAGSGAKLIPIRSLRIYNDKQTDHLGAMNISVEPTGSWQTSVAIVIWDHETGRAMVPPNSEDETTVTLLGRGHFRLELLLRIDGKARIHRRSFVIGADADSLDWIDPEGNRPN